MTAPDGVIDALNECRKLEHTLAQCALQYFIYWRRWRFFGIMKDFKKLYKCAKKSKKALMARIREFDVTPGSDAYPFEFTDVNSPEDIVAEMDYFVGMANDLIEAYVRAQIAATSENDSVTSSLLTRLKTKREFTLLQFEAKLKKVALLGAQGYLQEHVH